MLSDEQFRKLLGIGMIKKKQPTVEERNSESQNFLTSLLNSDTLEEVDESFGMSQTTTQSPHNQLSVADPHSAANHESNNNASSLTHNTESSPILTKNTTTEEMEQQIDKAFDELTQIDEDYVMISTPKKSQTISVNNKDPIVIDNEEIDEEPLTPPPQDKSINKQVWDESQEEVEQTPPRTARKKTPKKRTTPKKKSPKKVETSSNDEEEKKRKSPAKSKKSPSKKTKKDEEDDWDEKYQEEVKKLQEQFASIDKTHLKRYEVSNLQSVHFSDIYRE